MKRVIVVAQGNVEKVVSHQQKAGWLGTFGQMVTPNAQRRTQHVPFAPFDDTLRSVLVPDRASESSRKAVERFFCDWFVSARASTTTDLNN